MTVCIAARCRDIVFGASDRMLTSGDIQFESPAQKIIPLTRSIITMTSGETPFQGEILREVSLEVTTQVAQRPDTWLFVKDVVELYVQKYNERKRKRAEWAILAPLNLDQETFLAQQKNMDSALVDSIAKDLINYTVPTVSVIITGIDNLGAHIYVVHDGDPSCQDAVGFAAIGIGARTPSPNSCSRSTPGTLRCLKHCFLPTQQKRGLRSRPESDRIQTCSRLDQH